MPDRGNKCLLILMGLAFLSVSPGLWGADHYVRAGATGARNGSDWTNAWTQLPASLVRGDTYYIAAGVYPPYTFDDPESGTTPISVLKAVETAHGTDTGWDSAYGDGQALFTGNVGDYTGTITFNTGYWVFDGVKGIGQGTSEPYGFKITVQNDASSYLAKVSYGADYITISHTEMRHLTMGEPDTVVKRTKGIYAVDGQNGGSSYLHISHNYIHEVTMSMMQMNYVTNSVIEHNFMEHRVGGDYINANGDQVPIHGEAIRMSLGGMNANNTFRYNTFKDIVGTALLTTEDSIQSHFYIYGNLGFQTEDRFYVSNGAVANSEGDTNTYMYVFNNTFVDLKGISTGVRWYNGSNNYTYNNVWYNCQNVSFASTEHDYNWFCASGVQSEAHIQTGTQDPFVNRAAGDFRLAAHTDRGTSEFLASLPPGDYSYYTHDMNGNGRANWDRGAYEFPSAPDTQAPTVPQNVTATAASSTRIDLTWTASTDNVGVAYYEITRNDQPFKTVLQTEYSDKEVAPLTTYTYQVLAVDVANNRSELSGPLAVHTPADTVPPSIVELSASKDSVVLLFSERVLQPNLSSASEIAEYYTITPSLAIHSVTSETDSPPVILHTGTHSWGTTYTLHVQNVEDLCGNVMPPTSLTYSYGTLANPEGLIAYWKLDENAGAPIEDYSGNNNTGTPISDPQSVPGVWGLSLRFDGTSNSVDCGSKYSLNQLDDTFTISLWVRVLDPSRAGYILDKGGQRTGFYFRTHVDQTLLFKIDDGASDRYAQSNDTRIMDGRWHHIAGVLDHRTSLSLYIDGVRQSRFFNGPLSKIGSISNTYNLSQGSTSYRTGHFNGQIDEVRIYDRVLLPSEISDLGKRPSASARPENWMLY